jgi:hypothetical protein
MSGNSLFPLIGPLTRPCSPSGCSDYLNVNSATR